MYIVTKQTEIYDLSYIKRGKTRENKYQLNYCSYMKWVDISEEYAEDQGGTRVANPKQLG